MAWTNRDSQVTASVAGTGTGILASLIPGVGPGGALIGAGIGEAVSAIFGLDEKPNLPEVPPEMRQAAGLQMFGLAELAGMEGLSSKDVAKIGQLGQEDINSEVLKANTLGARMTPYDRKRLYDRLTELSRGSRRSLQDKVSMLDVGAVAKNAAALVQGGAMAANTQQSIQDIEFRNQIMYDKYRSQNLQAFAQGISNSLTGVFAGISMIKENQPGSATNPIKAEGMTVYGSDAMKKYNERLGLNAEYLNNPETEQPAGPATVPTEEEILKSLSPQQLEWERKRMRKLKEPGILDLPAYLYTVRDAEAVV